MRRNLESGESEVAGILVLAILILIVLISPKSTSTNTGSAWQLGPGTEISKSQENYGSGAVNYDATKPQVVNSNYKGNISISSGNASYTYQPYEEYIALDNYSSSPINITGWQLRNGKDRRTYYNGGSLQRFSADIATIPQATAFLSPTGNFSFQDVILKDGERVIITTGTIGVNTPYKIVSFKENMCTGYIEALSDYTFSPPLTQNCPRPGSDLGVSSLDIQCRTFINNLSSCRTPEFNPTTKDGASCNTCVNGTLLSSQCADFVKEHYNYKGCVAYHSSDTNFSGRTWRIFLGR